MVAFLLWHVNGMPDGEEDGKLIGVYSSRERAEEAKSRSLGLPGFREVPDGFIIDEYLVDQDNWTEGYVTIANEPLLREWEQGGRI